MNKLLLLSGLIFMIACSDNSAGDHDHSGHDTIARQVKDTSKKSLPAEATASIGGADLKIFYHAPAVRGRTIWGGLVPYDEVWVTGAHSATTLEVNAGFQVGDKQIPVGKYALFTIPSREAWTVIINKNWEQHLTDEYSETEDVARVRVEPVVLRETVERLRYQIVQAGTNTGTVDISWEKIKISFPIEIRK
jgi:hypothetical protein